MQCHCIQCVLSSISNQLIKVLGTGFAQIIDSLSISLQMVIYLETLIEFFEFLQFLKEWQVFSRILNVSDGQKIFTLSHNALGCRRLLTSWNAIEKLTFWDCCATIRTRLKSYMPNATSNNLSASHKKIV